MSWFTLAEFNAYIQGDADATTEALLHDLAVGAVRAATGQYVDLVTDGVLNLVAPEGTDLMLPQLPAAEPTDVKVDGVTVTDWYFDTDRLIRPAGWLAYDDTTGAPLRVQVTYTSGYAAIPSDLKRIALQAAARAYRNPQGLRSETIGGESYVYAIPATGDIPDVSLTKQEKREARRAVGLGGAYTVDLVPAYERPWWIT